MDLMLVVSIVNPPANGYLVFVFSVVWELHTASFGNVRAISSVNSFEIDLGNYGSSISQDSCI